MKIFFILMTIMSIICFLIGMFNMLRFSLRLTSKEADVALIKRGLMYMGGNLKDQLLDRFLKRSIFWFILFAVMLFISILYFENNPISSKPTP